MDKKTILVVGASGLVGYALYSKLKVRELYKRDVEVHGTTTRMDINMSWLDIRDVTTTDYMLRTRWDYVFFPAANPNVDLCEVDSSTEEVNVNRTVEIATRVMSKGAKFIWYSSSYVFDGTSMYSYGVYDERFPINMYGVQKVKVENELMRLSETVGGSCVIIRTVGVFGYEISRKNFVYSIVNSITDTKVKDVFVPNDQRMNPISSNELADKSIRIALDMDERNDVFHVAGDTCLSKYDFAVKIAEAYRLPTTKLVGLPSEDFNFKAPRPLMGCLDTSLEPTENLDAALKRFALYEI